MDHDERMEWMSAIHDLHRWSQWFMDRDGVVFSFAWFESIRTTM